MNFRKDCKVSLVVLQCDAPQGQENWGKFKANSIPVGKACYLCGV